MDHMVKDAVKFYWETRNGQQTKQAKSGVKDQGKRGEATGGKHMDGFSNIIRDTIINAGIPENCILKTSFVELPGYYRSEKKWDIVVVYNGVLGAAIELKSHMGPSFGNNFNNRTEEAIGSATGIWIAYREGRFGSHMFRPWLGYLFLLDDCEKSRSPVSVREPHFKVDNIFKEEVEGKTRDASYKKRYEILCRRLVLERIYDSSCFLAVDFSKPEIAIEEPNPALSFDNFSASLKAQMQILKNRPETNR